MKTKVVVFLFALMIFTCPAAAVAPPIPNPVIMFTGAEFVQIGGKQITRYHYDVFNKSEFPKELFTAAPRLPPCGNNTNASRTWVDIYDQNGKRLNGFCAITKRDDLTGLWFALETEVVPPSWIYIEFTDRQTNTKYKSNLADTVL